MTEPNPRIDAEASTCLRFGVLLLAAGASGYRVIRAVKRCARSVGFDSADVIVGFNTISCTFHRCGQFRTAVADVPLPGVNASRIEALETVAHSLLQSYRTPEVIDAALDEIERAVTLHGSVVRRLVCRRRPLGRAHAHRSELGVFALHRLRPPARRRRAPH